MAKKIKHQTTRALTGWAFISPWVIGFLLFTLFPILMSLFLSFNDVVYGAEGIMLEFVGFKNYMNAFSKNMECLEAIVVFLKDSIFMVFIINVFAVLFAVLLNTNIKGRGFFRTLFFLPVVIVSGPVMNQLVANEIITMPNLADLSVIRIIGTTFGPSIQELIVTSFSDLIYMFWFSGVQLIVYLSMIQKMDKSMYEAAEIDGASPWESFWKITLPSLKPVILINIIYTFILLASFDTNGVISVITETMKGTGTLGGAESFGYGLATAFSWIYFLILFLIVGIIFLVFYLRKKPKFSLAYNRERLGLPVNRYEKKVTKLNSNKTYKKVRRFFMGRKFSDGFFAKAFTYVLLTIVAFAFLYPFIDMLLVSLQSPEDVLNPMIGSLPSAFYIDNYVKAFKVLGFWKSLGNSVYYSLIPTICQVVAAAFVGYGLAKFQFKGKLVVMLLVVMTFIIPSQVTMIPTYMMYTELGFIGSIFSIALPALLGQGLKSAIFILIFYQSFSMIPKDLDEAAHIDGANSFQVFTKIAIPLSVPILIVGFIFSFVWYWNETYLLKMYVGPQTATLPMQLAAFKDTFDSIYSAAAGAGGMATAVNEAIYMAGTLVSILPLLILYFVLQRWFVEGIDRAGLTGQ